MDSAVILGTPTVLEITDTLSTTGTGVINAIENEFVQRGEPVPESGTILGLLAVGGLVLGLKRKKQLIIES